MTQYKKSQYNIEVEKLGSLIIYNTYSCKLIELDSIEYHYWMDDVSQLPDETINWLIQNRFLVVKGINETEHLFDEMLKSCLNQKRSFFRILTTTGCNADCTYCFEKEFPRKIMDEETANQLQTLLLLNQNNSKP